MITVSYHASQQMQRLSRKERHELTALLKSGDLENLSTKHDVSGKYISKFGEDKRVVWAKDSDDNIIVLTVVAR